MRGEREAGGGGEGSPAGEEGREWGQKERRKRIGSEDRNGGRGRQREGERRKKRAGASIKLCAVGELNPDLILGRDES